MGSGVYDTQILNQLSRSFGPDKVRVIGVSGDAVRARLEAFVTRLHLEFPIYFDQSAMNNALAQKFGVKGWATTFIFDKDGKLVSYDTSPGEPDWPKAVRRVLPDAPKSAFVVPFGTMVEPG